MVRWASEMRHEIPGLDHLFHPPNGGARNKVVAGQMVALGAKAGVPDLLLPYRSNGYIGLAAEMKTDTGRLSPQQVKWLERFREQGWYTAVWRSSEEAIDGIKKYLLQRL